MNDANHDTNHDDHPDLPKIDHLSVAQLNELMQRTRQAHSTKRTEELERLAKSYAEALKAAGITVKEGIEALRPFVEVVAAAKKTTKAAKTVDDGKDRAEAGVTYKLPDGFEWTRSATGKGPVNERFKEAIKAGATWEKLRKKDRPKPQESAGEGSQEGSGAA